MTTPLPARAAYSVAEVVALANIGRDSFYRLVREGKLPARKLGRRTIVLASDLEAFLKGLPKLGEAA
jgi:excisionase family DNA binding protein